MKKIYIVVSRTPTKMGRFIQFVTRFQYNHVSFSINRELTDLMSFARYYYHIPLYGGFVKENYERFDKGAIKIYQCEVSDENYYDICEYIQKFNQNPELYRYNLLNACLSPLKLRVAVPDYYTCEEFVSEILRLGKLTNANKNSIKEMCSALNCNCIFEGNIEDYPNRMYKDPCYFQEFSFLSKLYYTLTCLKLLVHIKNKYL